MLPVCNCLSLGFSIFSDGYFFRKQSKTKMEKIFKKSWLFGRPVLQNFRKGTRFFFMSVHLHSLPKKVVMDTQMNHLPKMVHLSTQYIGHQDILVPMAFCEY